MCVCFFFWQIDNIERGVPPPKKKKTSTYRFPFLCVVAFAILTYKSQWCFVWEIYPLEFHEVSTCYFVSKVDDRFFGHPKSKMEISLKFHQPLKLQQKIFRHVLLTFKFFRDQKCPEFSAEGNLVSQQLGEKKLPPILPKWLPTINHCRFVGGGIPTFDSKTIQLLDQFQVQLNFLV